MSYFIYISLSDLLFLSCSPQTFQKSLTIKSFCFVGKFFSVNVHERSPFRSCWNEAVYVSFDALFNFVSTTNIKATIFLTHKDINKIGHTSNCQSSLARRSYLKSFISRITSLEASRFLIVSRLSCSFLPRTIAISTLSL